MSTHSDQHVVRLDDVSGDVAAVGGKGAQLGELRRCDGVRVPEGFCVTTAAFRLAIARAPEIAGLIDRLTRLSARSPAEVAALSAEIRTGIERAGVPDEVAMAVATAAGRLGAHTAVAVRSSATTEDLPTASFAGQHDTFLNVTGSAAILRGITGCWASLFSDRAVAYRQRRGVDHRAVEMGVVVQRMVVPLASGVLFTADPLTGHRRTAAIEATLGLGEALVSGAVNADSYKVRGGAIVERTVVTKPTVSVPAPGGGTRAEPVAAGRADAASLTDEHVLELAALGRRIEACAGAPQDVEWCFDESGFHIVQSRPITTLFPVPEALDEAHHVYISVGHAQMMTDPMSPLGLSVWQSTSAAPMHVAGGRLYVDATAALSAPESRAKTLEVIGRSDPLTRDALETVLGRDDSIPLTSAAEAPSARLGGPTPAVEPGAIDALIERHEHAALELERATGAASGAELFDVIANDLEALREFLVDPEQRAVVMAGFEATWWLDDHLREWLGEEGVTAELSLAAPDNVSAEMGLALLDVADAIRPHPAVVASLRVAPGDTWLDDLPGVPGGWSARDAIVTYLDRYGMRCAGEIDIARPRWSERPSALLPALLANIDNFAPGERARRIERGQVRAQRKRDDVLGRVRDLPDGAAKAGQVDAMVTRMRAFIGYREYPKYAIVQRYLIYKRGLLREAERLVGQGMLDAVDDIFFLSLAELRAAATSGLADRALIARRRAEMRRYEELTPPRVLTSDGEAVNGAYRRGDVPPGALAGVGVSGGTIEGRARVVRDMADANVRPGDILVTAHTDPSWSPLFVTIAGLVTEAGGVTTHGSVIAREYGLAAVVGVERATEQIADGRRIRIHGTLGFVELL